MVVEHDPQVMLAADRIIDMGPGAGSAGGTIVFDGTPQSIRASKTETGLYLSGKKSCDGFKHKAFDRKKIRSSRSLRRTATTSKTSQSKFR